MINPIMYLILAIAAAGLWCYLSKYFKDIGDKVEEKISEVIEDDKH